MLPFARLVIAGLATCAVATPAMSQSRSRMRIALPAFGAQIVMDTIGEVQDVAAPPMKVFRAASMVLTNLRIAIDVSDSTAGLVGAAKLTRSRNLGGRALSRYLECGSNMTGPRADSHRVQMPLLLMLDPGTEGTTRLRIALVASAQDNSGTSTQAVVCATTGVLEGELRKAIKDQIAELR
ncbi:MAG: hypothetical protein H7066_15570 [Cytophagaceae bacterium]|nr:hypothetical protein [Gemmatimonadaceae bacterium]